MFGKKTLTEAVAALRSKVSEQSNKIAQKIETLEAEVEDIKSGLKTLAIERVQAELAGDTKALANIDTRWRDLQGRLAEAEELLEAFRAARGAANSNLYKDDLEKIRALAAKEREARYARLKDLQSKRDETERRIEALQQELKQLNAEIDRARVDQEAQALQTIADLIDPRIARIPDYERGRVIAKWITGEDYGEILARHLSRPDTEPRFRYERGEIRQNPNPK